MAMNGYEKLIKTMRDQVHGQIVQPFTFGTMKDGGKIVVGDLELETYYTLSGLTTDTKVSISGMEEEETDAHLIIEPGDTVLLCRLSEEQFVLLGKMEVPDVSV